MILFVPVLGAKEKHVEPAMRYLQGNKVHYYWSPDEEVMRLFGHSIGTDIALWDFWALYAAKNSWTGEIPPTPDFWQHQLTGLPEEQRLNIDEFNKQIDKSLSRLM